MRTFKLKSLALKTLSFVLVLFMVFTLIGCKDKDDVKMSMSLDKESYVKGEKVIVTVTVTGTANTDYELSIDDKDNVLSEIVKVNGKEVEIIGNPKNDKLVKIIATSKADPQVSCNESFIVKPSNDIEPIQNVKISLKADKKTVYYGETAKLTVTIENSEDKTYKYQISNTELVKVENNEVIVLKKVKVDTSVSISAIANAYEIARSTVTIMIKPEKINGKVENLTSDMIEKIGNESITVKGKLTDYYVNFKNANENRENKYNMEVQMANGIWKGIWSIAGQEEYAITDLYCKGELDGLTDQNGNIGHGMQKVFIDKNNKVAYEYIKDYISVPTIWEAQHLWNHLGSLDVNRFTFDKENGVYVYTLNNNSEEDLYLMTYLSFSLTPMLEDTLVNLYLTVENGEISKLTAQTEVLYYGDSTEEPDAMSYTVIELTFSEIGTTVVKEPDTYEAPEHAEVLEKAIKNMQTLKNYTFQAVDKMTLQPTGDDNDYEIQSVNNAKLRKMIIRNKVQNNSSSVGTEGTFGQITETEVLYATTFKYRESLDDKLYRTEYSGLKKIDNESYDEFEYDYTEQTLVGKRKRFGDMFDVLPKFDFSPNIFEFEISSKSKTGKTLYQFALRDSAITNDVAREFSCYKYAKDAYESTQYKLYVVVDEDGNFVKSFYPYSLVKGTYLGHVTTTYSKFNETQIELDTFDGYIPRVLKQNWSEYTTKYYKASYDEKGSRDVSTDVALADIFGDAVSDVPAPTVFLSVLGDNISGPFYDLEKKEAGSDGEFIYAKELCINVKTDNVDENGQMVGYEELMNELITALNGVGFAVSNANTDMTGGTTGRSNRYLCLIKNDVQIVIENNHTRYLWIYFYKTGDWTLSK